MHTKVLVRMDGAVLKLLQLASTLKRFELTSGYNKENIPSLFQNVFCRNYKKNPKVVQDIFCIVLKRLTEVVG